MKLIPNYLLSDLIKQNYSRIDESVFIQNIGKYTSSVDCLFNNALFSKNSFSANEIWGMYCNSWRLSKKIFFPDVAIFSKKIRTVDLFRNLFYACYSDFSERIVRNHLKSRWLHFFSKVQMVVHPYVLIDRNWNKAELMSELSFFKDSALFVMPKSTDVIERSIKLSQLMQAIESCKKHANRVTLCIYYKDLSKYLNIQLPSDCDIVCCGSRYDALFYYRLNLLITAHKFVASFEPGTHNVYATVSSKPQLLLGDKVHEELMGDKYQLARYPSASDLNEFKSCCHKIIAAKQPTLVPDLAQFVEISKEPELVGFLPSLYAYPLHKIFRRLIKFFDSRSRKVYE